MRGATAISGGYGAASRHFNPRSPCGERHVHRVRPVGRAQFQSTLPMRGATIIALTSAVLAIISIHAPHAGSDIVAQLLFVPSLYFNPRSPCGERRTCPPSTCQTCRFQSTLPMRGATNPLIGIAARQAFQSTLPMRGATHLSSDSRATRKISIHAPHAGSDVSSLNSYLFPAYISIHAPHAGSDSKS